MNTGCIRLPLSNLKKNMWTLIVCKDYFQLESFKKKTEYGYIRSNKFKDPKNDHNCQSFWVKFFSNERNLFTPKKDSVSESSFSMFLLNNENKQLL